jgi:hypothetical protein
MNGIESRTWATYALLVAMILIATPCAVAQSARHGAYFEIGGSAAIPSLNYERNVRGPWWGRVGLSVVTAESSTDSDTTFVAPLTVSHVNRPDGNHHLELGGGLTVSFGDEQDWYDFEDDEEDDFASVFATGIVGYRYQKPDGGFQFRAVVTPFLGEPGLFPWAGVSFGYSW